MIDKILNKLNTNMCTWIWTNVNVNQPVFVYQVSISGEITAVDPDFIPFSFARKFIEL